MKLYHLLKGKQEFYATTTNNLEQERTLDFLEESYRATGRIVKKSRLVVTKEGEGFRVFGPGRPVTIKSCGEVDESYIENLKTRRGLEVARLETKF